MGTIMPPALPPNLILNLNVCHRVQMLNRGYTFRMNVTLGRVCTIRVL